MLTKEYKDAIWVRGKIDEVLDNKYETCDLWLLKLNKREKIIFTHLVEQKWSLDDWEIEEVLDRLKVNFPKASFYFNVTPEQVMELKKIRRKEMLSNVGKGIITAFAGFWAGSFFLLIILSLIKYLTTK